MKTLRAKIAALLVGAILFVVGLATLIMIQVLDPPSFEKHAAITATQLRIVLTLMEGVSKDGDRPIDSTIAAREARLDKSGLGFLKEPVKGSVLKRETRALRAALKDQNLPLTIDVIQPANAGPSVASVPVLGRGWLVIPIAIPPPPAEGWLIFSGWMALVTLGATGVAIAVVHRMTRPLALLEQAVEAVGPDGTLPKLAEDGPTEVQATARAINLLSARLHSAMQSRMRLVAAAGHDLRTPMTRMRLRAEFLDEDERNRWLADLDELDRIADSAIRLVREEVEGLPMEPTQIDDLVRSCVQELAELGLAARAVRAKPIAVRVSPHSLKRALRNLIANAATHGGGAEVSVRLEGKSALIIIEDHGPGIPEPLLQQVFEPFFQVDPARRRSIAGAGLGLAIAKEIVVRNSGTIVLSNRPGGGLRQEIRLPAL